MHFLLCVKIIAKTYNPPIPDLLFQKFSVPSPKDVDNDREEMLLCPLLFLKRSLNRTKQ